MRSSSSGSTSLRSTPRRKRLLAPDQLTWVVVGDLSGIEADVRALGFGAVQIVDVDGKPVGSP